MKLNTAKGIHSNFFLHLFVLFLPENTAQKFFSKIKKKARTLLRKETKGRRYQPTQLYPSPPGSPKLTCMYKAQISSTLSLQVFGKDRVHQAGQLVNALC